MRQWCIASQCVVIWLLALLCVNAYAQPVVGMRLEDGHLAVDSKRSIPLPMQGGAWSVVLSQGLAREVPKSLPIGVTKGYEQARFMFDNAVSPTWLVVLRHSNPYAPVPIMAARFSMRTEAWRSSVCEGLSEFGALQELYGTQLNGNSQRCSAMVSVPNLADFQTSPHSSTWAAIINSGGAFANLVSGSYVRVSWRMQEFGGHNLQVEALVRAGLLEGTGEGGISNETVRQINPEQRVLSEWLSEAVQRTANAYFKGQQLRLADVPTLQQYQVTTPISSVPSVIAAPSVSPVSHEAEMVERNRLKADAAQREQELERLRVQLAQAELQRQADALKIAEAQRLQESQRQAQVVRQAEEAHQQVRQAEQTAEAQRVAALNSGKRKALVIGNDLYRNVPKLDNARSDARAMGQALQSLGFKVTVALDLDERAMKDTLRYFKAGVQGGDEVVVFYAGHGVQLGSANYLLPVDIAARDEGEVRDYAIQMQRILDDMQEQRTKFMLLIVDACRDNPFKTAGRAVGGRGLAPTNAATGQMVIFSAGAGQQALDRLGPTDRNPNGVFTRLLLEEMKRPSVPIHQVIRNVRDAVADLASSVGHEQVPALYDQSRGDFFLKP